MRMYDIINKKRHGIELSEAEINFMIEGYTGGDIPDYQMSAFAMAVIFNSMTDRETAAMTVAMARSGDTVDLSLFGELSVDKHSTGGVGDKTSLIIAPIVASCGTKLAKMSGRGLGHTGGTVDKLSSITGYKTELSQKDFLSQTEKTGIAMIGQSGNLTPADKKLYALRDVTATVDSIPLIVSSIMSKKLAAGAKTIVLDVKTGSGAFMTDPKDAEVLARKMVDIGKACGRNTAALITNMDVPLGKAVGNSLEVIEAVSLLKNESRGELCEICLSLSSLMISLALKISESEARERAEQALISGQAYGKLKEWISAQGGDISLIENTELFPKAEYIYKVKAQKDGYITKMNTEAIGNVSSVLGAGRAKITDSIDYSAGIIIEKKTGDLVKVGDTLAILHTNKRESIKQAESLYLEAITQGDHAPSPLPLIIKKIV